MKFDRVKDNPALLLMLGATIVAVSRYIVVFAHTERFQIAGPVWQWFTALSGIGMALLEGFAVWFCWNSWSKAPASRERNVLIALIVGMFATLTGAVAPTIYATSQGLTVVDVLPSFWLWMWTLCVTVAPLLVMAASGLADKLRGPAVSVKALAPVVNVSPSPETALMTEPQAASQALDLTQVIEANPQGSYTEWAKAMGISRQAVQQRVKRLEADGKLRVNGHIEVTR